MKKHYMKPEIVFEDFSLTVNISAGCEHISNQAEDMCGYATRSGVIFTSAIGGCIYTEVNNSNITSGGEYTVGNDTLCYHVPNVDNNLFSS